MLVNDNIAAYKVLASQVGHCRPHKLCDGPTRYPSGARGLACEGWSSFFSTIQNAAASSKELDSSQIQTFNLGRGYALTYCSDYYGVPK